MGGAFSFCVERILSEVVYGTQITPTDTVAGVLLLNRPVCALKDAADGRPIVAMTLRRIEGDVAKIQITAQGDMIGARPGASGLAEETRRLRPPAGP